MAATSTPSILRFCASVFGAVCALYAIFICAWILPSAATLSGKGFILGVIVFAGFIGSTAFAWGASRRKLPDWFLPVMALGVIAGCLLMIFNLGALHP